MYILTEILKLRYKQYLLTLKDDWIPKTILAFFATIWTIISEIFSTPSEPAILLIILIIIDLITGIVNAKRNKTALKSLGLRQTWIKFIEYAVGLFILTGIANVFGRSDLQNWVGDVLRFCRNIDWFGYFYLIITEFKSITENIGGNNNGFTKIINKINEKMWGAIDDEEIR